MTTHIRLATPEDAADILTIYTPIVETTAISFEEVTPTLTDMQQRITGTNQHYPWLICADDAFIAGYAYASQHRSRAAYRWAVDVSVYIHEDARRRNLGRALYTALFVLLRAQGYYNAFAGIRLPNAGSVGLHEALGFQPLGVYQQVGYKFGEWHDVGWWQLMLQATNGEPTEPRPVTTLIDSPAWEQAITAGMALMR